MIDRLMRLVIEALVTIVALSVGLDLANCVLHQVVTGLATSVTRAVPTIIADVLATLMTGIFFVGLGVRVHRNLTGRGGRAARENGARERQIRLTVRRPAEDMPAIAAQELPVDPDPAISTEDN